MAKGGAREGAGRPKGSLAPQNRQKILFERYLISRIVAEKKELIDALLKAGKSGEVKAITEALNRLLGKSKESIDVTSEGQKIYGWTTPSNNNIQPKRVDAPISRKSKKVEDSNLPQTGGKDNG